MPMLNATGSHAQAFNSLATEEDLRRRMMELGATSSIIALANSSKNNMLRSECLEALCKLAAVPGSETQIIAEVLCVSGDPPSATTKVMIVVVFFILLYPTKIQDADAARIP